MSAKGAPLLHTLVEPLVPALAGGFTVTITVAEAFAQGGAPITV